MQTKQQIHELVDRLPESETGAAARYLEFLLGERRGQTDASARQNAPWDTFVSPLHFFRATLPS
jgi:hypothetical protein